MMKTDILKPTRQVTRTLLAPSSPTLGKSNRHAKFLAICLLSIFCFHASANEIIDYEFNNSLLDSSGYGNNGIGVGTIHYASSDSSYGVQFTNPYEGPANEYVEIPNSESVTALDDSSLTFAIRYESTDTSQHNGRLFGGGWNGPQIAYDYNSYYCAQGYCQIQDDTGHTFNVENQVIGNPAAYTTTGDYNWAICVLDRQSSVLKLYVNDTLVGDVSCPDLAPISVQQLIIGGVAGQLDSSAMGTTVDRFLMFNTALTDPQISTLVNTGAAPVPEPHPAILLFATTALVFAKRKKS